MIEKITILDRYQLLMLNINTQIPEFDWCKVLLKFIETTKESQRWTEKLQPVSFRFKYSYWYCVLYVEGNSYFSGFKQHDEVLILVDFP